MSALHAGCNSSVGRVLISHTVGFQIKSYWRQLYAPGMFCYNMESLWCQYCQLRLITKKLESLVSKVWVKPSMSNFFPRIKGFLIFPVFFHPFHFTAARSCVFFSILSTSPQPGHVFVQFLPADKRLPHISGVFPSFPLHRSQVMCFFFHPFHFTAARSCVCPISSRG